MIYREKVIKSMRALREAIVTDRIREVDQAVKTLDNAIALLKEKETVEPKTVQSSRGWWYTCGACGWWLFEVRDTVHFENRKRVRFCASCGRAVKWDD